MITTVTLNAAIDKTYYLPSFSPAQVMRVRQMFAEPGGKGLNVARVIHKLGYPVRATGIVGGNNGRFIENALSKQGIEHDFVHIEDESRLCLNIIDDSSGTSTEVLEQGPVVQEDVWLSFQTKLAELAASSRIVCFSGSLPKGIPEDGYAQLIRIVKQAGALAFLDTSGAALIRGISSVPDFIKPNEDEIGPLMESRNLRTAGWNLPDAIQCLQADTGIPTVTVSLGAEGSITGFSQTILKVKAPKLRAVNTVGCGDSFVAGIAAATLIGVAMEQRVQWATAAAAANALTERAGYIEISDFLAFKEQISLEQH